MAIGEDLEEKIREFGSVAILHKRKLSRAFQEAHRELNGQEYAYLRILKYLQEGG